MLALTRPYTTCSAEGSAATSEYISVSDASIGAEKLRNMVEGSPNMWLTAGYFNEASEKAFAEKLCVKLVIICNSGSGANLLAISALASPSLDTRHFFAGNILHQPVLTKAKMSSRVSTGEQKLSCDLTEADYAALPRTDFIVQRTFGIDMAQNNTMQDMPRTGESIHVFIKQDESY